MERRIPAFGGFDSHPLPLSVVACRDVLCRGHGSRFAWPPGRVTFFPGIATSGRDCFRGRDSSRDGRPRRGSSASSPCMVRTRTCERPRNGTDPGRLDGGVVVAEGPWGEFPVVDQGLLPRQEFVAALADREPAGLPRRPPCLQVISLVEILREGLVGVRTEVIRALPMRLHHCPDGCQESGKSAYGFRGLAFEFVKLSAPDQLCFPQWQPSMSRIRGRESAGFHSVSSRSSTVRAPVL